MTFYKEEGVRGTFVSLTPSLVPSLQDGVHSSDTADYYAVFLWQSQVHSGPHSFFPQRPSAQHVHESVQVHAGPQTLQLAMSMSFTRL